MNMQGKIGLVLGASRGIGLAIARLLAQQGVRLALPWFDWPESAAAMTQEFSHGEQGHFCCETDLRDPVAIATLMTEITARFGVLDVLVNNIERGGMPIVHGSYERPINGNQWQLEMETTLQAKWHVFNQALPLLKQSASGAVVNISSIAAVVGRSGPAAMLFNDGYAAANRAVASFTESWARMGAPTVRVNELMLGFIDSRHGPGTRGWDLLPQPARQELLAHSLLQRTGTPEEVAAAVLFLLRDASFLTGATIRMDGGYVLGGDRSSPMPDGVL